MEQDSREFSFFIYNVKHILNLYFCNKQRVSTIIKNAKIVCFLNKILCIILIDLDFLHKVAVVNITHLNLPQK